MIISRRGGNPQTFPSPAGTSEESFTQFADFYASRFHSFESVLHISTGPTNTVFFNSLSIKFSRIEEP